MPYRERVSVVACACVALALSCDSPFEPRGEGERIPIGRIISGSLDATDSVHRYSFRASAGREYAVFFEATDGVVTLVVRDSVTGDTWAAAFDQIGAPGLEQNATENMRASADQVFLIELRGLGAGPTERYRLLVYEVATAPESLASRFTIGDSVNGEMLDPVADVDEFVARGQAGQEIAGIIYGLNAAGTGLLGLSVTDTTTGEQLGLSRGAPGSPEFSTASGRFTLPGTRDYRFTVRGIRFGGRFTGPYRFRFHTIHRAPEAIGATVVPNTEIRGEAIDEFGDVDEFTFSSAAHAEYNVFLQGLAPRQARLEVGPAGGPASAAILTVPGDTGLLQHATGRFTVAQAGPVMVRVTGVSDFQVRDTGAYRFYVYAVNPLPEHVTPAVTLGDTVSGEAIDLPGDVDEFLLSGNAGDEFNLLFQAQSGRADLLRIEIVGSADTSIAAVEAVGTDTSLFQHATGRFALPVAGTYRVRVTGATSTSDVNTGPYRFFCYPVDRRPETVPQTLAFGDSVSRESIDLPGDIDEFTVVVPDSSGALLALEIEAALPAGEALRATGRSSTDEIVGEALASTPGVRVDGGRLRLGPGTHTIQVEGSHSANRSLLRGAYRLWIYRFAFVPELASDTFAIGDTVSEVVNPPGDVDRFHFFGTRGQLVNITIQGMSAPSNGAYQLWLGGPGNGDVPPFLFVVSPTSAAALGDHQTMRLDLPGTGWYQISVLGGTSQFEVGPYRFAVEPIDPSPEHVSAALAPGDSVTTEEMNVPGDWDEYTITATPGEELVVGFGAKPPDFNFPYALVFDRAAVDAFDETAGQAFGLAGPFHVPASGQVAVAVREHAFTGRFCYDATCGGIFHFVGPYRLSVIRVDRSPESASAGYTVGDTTRGESISPMGDIDEFTASGTPGERLTVFYRLTALAVPDGGTIQLTVVDPATGAVLVGNDHAAIGTSFFSPGSFTVPAGGSFIVRLQAYAVTDVATAPYEFFITREP